MYKGQKNIICFNMCNKNNLLWPVVGYSIPCSLLSETNSYPSHEDFRNHVPPQRNFDGTTFCLLICEKTFLCCFVEKKQHLFYDFQGKKTQTILKSNLSKNSLNLKVSGQMYITMLIGVCFLHSYSCKIVFVAF